MLEYHEDTPTPDYVPVLATARAARERNSDTRPTLPAGWETQFGATDRTSRCASLADNLRMATYRANVDPMPINGESVDLVESVGRAAAANRPAWAARQQRHDELSREGELQRTYESAAALAMCTRVGGSQEKVAMAASVALLALTGEKTGSQRMSDIKNLLLVDAGMATGGQGGAQNRGGTRPVADVHDVQAPELCYLLPAIVARCNEAQTKRTLGLFRSLFALSDASVLWAHVTPRLVASLKTTGCLPVWSAFTAADLDFRAQRANVEFYRRHCRENREAPAPPPAQQQVAAFAFGLAAPAFPATQPPSSSPPLAAPAFPATQPPSSSPPRRIGRQTDGSPVEVTAVLEAATDPAAEAAAATDPAAAAAAATHLAPLTIEDLLDLLEDDP